MEEAQVVQQLVDDHDVVEAAVAGLVARQVQHVDVARGVVADARVAARGSTLGIHIISVSNNKYHQSMAFPIGRHHTLSSACLI